MKLVPWRRQNDDSFFKPLADFRREFDSLFDSFFRGGDLMETGTGFTPKIEVAEDDNAYTVKAELPGLDEKDIEVTVDDNVLMIKGEKKEEKEEKKGKNSFYRETRYGSFYRQIPLRHEVKEDKVGARFKKGILRST